jgi:hypothetical protein
MVIDGYLVQYTFFNQSFEITIKSYPIAGCRHLSGNIRCRKSYIAVLQNIDELLPDFRLTQVMFFKKF